MRRPSASIGLKLTLSLLVFLLILGGATAGIILYSFERTQDNATRLSQSGLEQLGLTNILYQATSQGSVGVAQMAWAADAGHIGARFFVDSSRAGSIPPLDEDRLARTPAGVVYDATEGRLSDIVLPNIAELSPAALQDIRDSAVLDLMFPSLLASYPGRTRDPGFDGIAVYFTSVNQVTRYYPSIGLHNIARPDIDLAPRLRQIGPEGNPDRETSWTAPYDDAAGQGFVISAYTPIYDGDVYRGMIGVDLSMAKLVDVVNNVQPTENSFSFYVDREGELLPSMSYGILSEVLESREGGALMAAMDAMRRGEEGVARVSIGGRETFVAYAPLQGIGGSFAVASPIDELTAQAAAITASIQNQGSRTLTMTLVGMGVLFLIGLGALTLLNRYMLVRPIEALVAGTQSVAAGNVDTQIEVKGDDELTTLARSFNEMTAGIKARNEALEREVRERREAQDELRALFAAMTDYVIVADGEGRYLRVQATNTPAYLTPPEYLAGKTMQEVMPIGQAETFLEPIREALREKTTHTVEYPLDLEGHTYWFSCAISPISDDSVVIVGRDITERVAYRQELERRVEERTRELEAVLDISRNVASTLELRPLLQMVIDQLKTAADYDRASIYLLEGDELVLLHSRQDTGDSAPISLRFRASTFTPMWTAISRGQHYIIDNLRDDTEAARSWQAAAGDLFDTAFKDIHSWLGVPLALKDRMLGMLTVSHEQASFYNEHHAQLVAAIASQAAIAIENARLYRQAQQLAAVEERQRLARELHDSVSQALYGIALGSRTARTLLDRDPSKAVEPMEYVLSLAEAGLAEMRALIFELRPESLEIEGLVAALDKQIAATSARYGVAVKSELGDEPSLPLSDKEVFYRVGQEALHNMIKHSRATEASVRLWASNGDISLEVRDNGVGFDAGASFPGHMGLVSMAERAASIGARLEVESKPGEGTSIRLLRGSGAH